MSTTKSKARVTASWLFLGVLIVLCGCLGILQYRWIGEVSLAARDRLRSALQANLVRLSQDLNSEIATSCRALLPATPPDTAAAAESEIERRFQEEKRKAQAGHLFRRIGLVVPEHGVA